MAAGRVSKLRLVDLRPLPPGWKGLPVKSYPLHESNAMSSRWCLTGILDSLIASF